MLSSNSLQLISIHNDSGFDNFGGKHIVKSKTYFNCALSTYTSSIASSASVRVDELDLELGASTLQCPKFPPYLTLSVIFLEKLNMLITHSLNDKGHN